MPHTYKLIVIGLGAMGSSTLFHAAKLFSQNKPNQFFNKRQVLGLKQFTAPHDKGSSHGETRITRESIFY